MEDHWNCRIEEEHLSPGILEDVIKWMYLLPVRNMKAKVNDLLAAAEYFQVSRIISVAEPRFFGWSRWAGADLKFELEPIFLGRLRLLFLASEKRNYWNLKDVNFSLYRYSTVRTYFCIIIVLVDSIYG